jgi:DNA primase
MRYANPTRGTFPFRCDLLPTPAEYYRSQGLKLTGGGEWKNALCPFHNDTKPSLRVRLDSGGFRCMVCGAHGGDVLAFHRQLYGLGFIEAAKQLGAWGLRP